MSHRSPGVVNNSSCQKKWNCLTRAPDIRLHNHSIFRRDISLSPAAFAHFDSLQIIPIESDQGLVLTFKVGRLFSRWSI